MSDKYVFLNLLYYSCFNFFYLHVDSVLKFSVSAVAADNHKHSSKAGWLYLMPLV